MSQARVLYCPSCGAASQTPAGPEPVPCAYCKAVLHPLRCPWCFAWGFAEAKDCPACGAAAPKKEESPRSCPTCRVLLDARERGGIRLCGCPGCGGVWADSASFKRLCEDRTAQAAYLGEGSVLPGPKTSDPSLQTVVYRPCAACGEMMNRINFAGSSGVVLDACRPHGVWFDPEELARIVAFVRDGGLDAARERELRRLQDETRRLERGSGASSLPQVPGEPIFLPLLPASGAARGLLKLLFG